MNITDHYILLHHLRGHILIEDFDTAVDLYNFLQDAGYITLVMLPLTTLLPTGTECENCIGRTERDKYLREWKPNDTHLYDITGYVANKDFILRGTADIPYWKNNWEHSADFLDSVWELNRGIG